MAKKKSKKKTQKKRQAKALKKRSVKKAIRKTRPKKKQFMMNMPGNIPGGMSGPAKSMMDFSEPIVMLAQPQDMTAMQSLATVIQGFWQGFAEQDMAQRDIKLAALKTAYEQQPWSSEMDFEALCDIMLKRHIHFSPESHTEEELNRFTAEEIQAAVDVDFSPEDAEVTTETGETPAVTTPVEEPVAAAPAFTLDMPEVPEIDTATVKALLPDDDFAALSARHQELAGLEGGVNFYQEDDPNIAKARELHSGVVSLFGKYLESQEFSATEVSAQRKNIRSFLNNFLIDNRQNYLLSFEADLVEEFILDYFFRKMKVNEAGENLLLTSFTSFFTLMEKAGFISGSQSYIDIVLEAKEEYEDLLQDKREG